MFIGENSYRYDHSSVISSHGTRWATEKELQQRLSCVDMSKDESSACGAPLISDGQTAWVNNGDVHTLVIGSTGSKKTRLVIMPTIEMIARAGESLICTDPKGELYDRTSGFFKQKGYQVLVLNLRDPKRSNGWSILHDAVNAYSEGRSDDAYSMLNDFAALIYPDNPKQDPFWAYSARGIFAGVCGMIAEKPELFCGRINLNTVHRLTNNALSEDSEGLSGQWDTNGLLREYYPADSISRGQIEMMCVGSEKTNDNISVSVNGPLQVFFSSKSLTDMLSTPEISLKDIGLRKTVVYIIVPDEKTTLNMLVSLFVKRSYEELISAAQQQKNRMLPVRVNYVLDEFCNMPMIPDMSAMISAARSRNIRFTLVIQGFHQLRGKYGQDAENIKGNCNDWIYLASREMELLQEISGLCGTDSRTQEPLITVSQLQRLSKQRGEALLLCGREYPIITHLADISSYPVFETQPVPFPQLAEKAAEGEKNSEDTENQSSGSQAANPDWKPYQIKTEDFVDDPAGLEELRRKGLTNAGQILMRFEHGDDLLRELWISPRSSMRLVHGMQRLIETLPDDECEFQPKMLLLSGGIELQTLIHEAACQMWYALDLRTNEQPTEEWVLASGRNSAFPAADDKTVIQRLRQISSPYVADVVTADRHSWLRKPYIVLKYEKCARRARHRLRANGGPRTKGTMQTVKYPSIHQPLYLHTFYHVLKGLKALHDKQLFYGNLSMKTIMLSENDYEPLLYDFSSTGCFGTSIPRNGLISGISDTDAMMRAVDAYFDAARDRKTGNDPADYESPERKEGRALDARSDVYSAGVLLQKLIASNGHPNERWQKAFDALKKIAEKAMEKEPAERYQTIDEMIAAFEAGVGIEN